MGSDTNQHCPALQEQPQLVSVICTVKNGSATLEETILSLIQQTYQNWELILIDDYSSDTTWQLMEDYAKKDTRIGCIKNRVSGRSNALNLGVSLATGKYIAILDADDLFHPQKLGLQVAAFKDNPTAFLIATERIILFGDEKAFWRDIESKPSQNGISNSLLLRNSITHSSVLMDKNTLISLGSYNTGIKAQFDYELWLKALTDKHLMIKLDCFLTAKRLHQNQSFENKNRFAYIWSSAKLQWSYIWKNRKLLWLPVPLFVLIYAMLPLSVRRLFFKKPHG